MDFEIDPTSNKRLLFLRYIKAFAKHVGSDDGDVVYLTPIAIGVEYGINLETIHAVLTMLRELGHVEIDQEPNYRLSEATRARRDDEEDYYRITLNLSFNAYYNAVEAAASFFMADQMILSGAGIQAELNFESMTIPVVTTPSTAYRLPTMRSGIAFNIISYCFSRRPNQELSVTQLKSELKAAQIDVAGISNLKENIRNSLFGKDNPLSPFVVVSPKAILVRPTALLSSAQVSAVAKEAHKAKTRNSS